MECKKVPVQVGEYVLYLNPMACETRFHRNLRVALHESSWVPRPCGVFLWSILHTLLVCCGIPIVFVAFFAGAAVTVLGEVGGAGPGMFIIYVGLLYLPLYWIVALPYFIVMYTCRILWWLWRRIFCRGARDTSLQVVLECTGPGSRKPFSVDALTGADLGNPLNWARWSSKSLWLTAEYIKLWIRQWYPYWKSTFATWYEEVVGHGPSNDTVSI